MSWTNMPLRPLGWLLQGLLRKLLRRSFPGPPRKPHRHQSHSRWQGCRVRGSSHDCARRGSLEWVENHAKGTSDRNWNGWNSSNRSKWCKAFLKLWERTKTKAHWHEDRFEGGQDRYNSIETWVKDWWWWPYHLHTLYSYFWYLLMRQLETCFPSWAFTMSRHSAHWGFALRATDSAGLGVWMEEGHEIWLWLQAVDQQ